MRLHRRPLPAVLLLTTAMLGSSAAWCFCAPPAALTSAHGCCEEGPGLVSGDGGCCRDGSAGQAARDVVVRGGGPLAPLAVAVLASRPIGPRAAPLPIRAHAVSAPAVVLRV